MSTLAMPPIVVHVRSVPLPAGGFLVETLKDAHGFGLYYLPETYLILAVLYQGRTARVENPERKEVTS